MGTKLRHVPAMRAGKWIDVIYDHAGWLRCVGAPGMTDGDGAASTLSIREKGAGQVFSVKCEVPAGPIRLAISEFGGWL